MKKTIVVCGAGGFIGGHLVSKLMQESNFSVRAVDHKPFEQWYQKFDQAENMVLDLQKMEACLKAVEGASEVYNLAADMGGMGFIENNKALCMLSVLINTHLLMSSKESGVERFFFASSACVYNHDKQTDPSVTGLKEADAYPAMPEDGYGWEKLFSERMCRHFNEDFGIISRVARYHNVYGAHGTFDGGREKAPAEFQKSNQQKCRVKTKLRSGGRESDCSFMYIDDCVKGTQAIMNSEDVVFQSIWGVRKGFD